MASIGYNDVVSQYEEQYQSHQHQTDLSIDQWQLVGSSGSSLGLLFITKLWGALSSFYHNKVP